MAGSLSRGSTRSHSPFCQHSVADAIKILKGSTARKLFVKFPELKKQLWGGHLWSPSYYVGTAGNVSSETIQKYIERTEHIKGRR